MLRLPSAALLRQSFPLQTPPGFSIPFAHWDQHEDSSGEACSSSGACPCRELSSVVDIQRHQVLGMGGFGTVYLARLHGSGQPCAVKTLQKDTSWARDLAIRESEILGIVSHPGICQLLEVVEDEENVYLVLEHIDGCQLLYEILEQKRMSQCRAVEIMRQVMDALSYCHSLERAVVHRDLKPENIMLKSTELGTEVKLIEFGLASLSGQQLDGVAGTLPYLALEASMARCTCSLAMDMWSVGVILHTLLFGELPSKAVRTGSTTLDTTGKRWQSISASARELLSGLLCANPQSRLIAAEVASHPWLSGMESPPKQVDQSGYSCSPFQSENSTRASTCTQDSFGDYGRHIGVDTGTERDQAEELACGWRQAAHQE